MDMNTDHSGDMDMDMNMTMSMQMTFVFSKECTVLFDKWHFTTMGGLFGSIIAVFCMAFAYEALKFYRSVLLRSNSFGTSSRHGGESSFTESILNKSHLIQTLLQAIQVTLSYFLMLVFMTYNGGLCIGVVLGLVVGYFVFGWKIDESIISEEHCP